MKKFTLYHVILAVAGFALASSLVTAKTQLLHNKSQNSFLFVIFGAAYTSVGVILLGTSISIILIAVNKGVTVRDMFTVDHLGKTLFTLMLIFLSTVWLICG